MNSSATKDVTKATAWPQDRATGQTRSVNALKKQIKRRRKTNATMSVFYPFLPDTGFSFTPPPPRPRPVVENYATKRPHNYVCANCKEEYRDFKVPCAVCHSFQMELIDRASAIPEIPAAQTALKLPDVGAPTRPAYWCGHCKITYRFKGPICPVCHKIGDSISSQPNDKGMPKGWMHEVEYKEPVVGMENTTFIDKLKNRVKSIACRAKQQEEEM